MKVLANNGSPPFINARPVALAEFCSNPHENGQVPAILMLQGQMWHVLKFPGTWGMNFTPLKSVMPPRDLTSDPNTRNPSIQPGSVRSTDLAGGCRVQIQVPGRRERRFAVDVTVGFFRKRRMAK